MLATNVHRVKKLKMFKINPTPQMSLERVKTLGREWVKEDIIDKGLTMTQPGSLKYLLFGSAPSRQSVSIKFGKLGEYLFMEMIKSMPALELLKCGVQCIDEKGKKKDFDLLWANNTTKIIYYRELKGNIELDSEKLPATFEKIPEILQPHIEKKYPDYTIDVGICNWSVYNRSSLKKGLSHIKKCEENGVKVEHVSDFLKTIDFTWAEEDYYEYFRELGGEVDKMFK